MATGLTCGDADFCRSAGVIRDGSGRFSAVQDPSPLQFRSRPVRSSPRSRNIEHASPRRGHADSRMTRRAISSTCCAVNTGSNGVRPDLRGAVNFPVLQSPACRLPVPSARPVGAWLQPGLLLPGDVICGWGLCRRLARGSPCRYGRYQAGSITQPWGGTSTRFAWSAARVTGAAVGLRYTRSERPSPVAT